MIGLRERGLTYGATAAQTGLSQTGVFNICQRFAAAGMAGLASQPRGSEPGTGALLQAGQEAEIRALTCQHTPDEVGLPCALWSRAAVRALVEQRAGVRLAVRTMGTYLACWGFTAQKPLRRAYEQRPDSQGCSTLRNSEHSEQLLDADETGAVAILAERVGLVGLEDIEGEAAQAGEHAGVFAAQNPGLVRMRERPSPEVTSRL